ncbi:interleukin enhancer-binding factor 2 homolog [Chironomus tepperi]|uniref:interleukin enhancer-binding factor 2 homolog n=1 Tax=Chironomus tepperi TaxID=113505 RepID=UPI00391F6AF3
MYGRKFQRNQFLYYQTPSPFDLPSLNESLYFPKVNESDNDSMILHTNLLNSLYRKNTQLNPSNFEGFTLNELVTKVTSIIRHMMSAQNEFQAFRIKEILQVGSFKNGTMRCGKNVADLLILLDRVPTTMLVQEMSVRMHALLNDMQSVQIVPKCEYLSVEMTSKGLDIFNDSARVSVLIGTYPEYVIKISEENLRTAVKHNIAAIQHSKFMEENSNPFAKILSRVLKFIIERNEKLSAINPWMIDAFACYSIFSNYLNQPLSLNQAFLRAFQLLSTGIFTISYGVPDPCKNFQFSINHHLHVAEEKDIIEAAQGILNKILDGKVDEVLELSD